MNTYLEIVTRSLSVYFFMLIALRLFGKQQLSQLNTADIILILLISNAVQNAMVGPDTSLQGGLLAAFVLFLVNFVVKRLMKKYKSLETLIEQKPEVLIRNGKAEFDTLSRIGITAEELNEAMREHGVDNIKDVKLAMMEMDGNISIVTASQNQYKETHYKRKHNHKNLQGPN